MDSTVNYVCSLFPRTRNVAKAIRISAYNLVWLAFIFLFGIAALVLCLIYIIALGSSIANSSQTTHKPLTFVGSNIVNDISNDHDKQNHGEKNCNLFSGRWVYDSKYPLYNVSSCPFVEPDLRCETNGRIDRGYTKWKWQPWGCNLPVFNAQESLHRMQNMRVTFVGDSMGRSQWESLVCMLMEGLSDKQSVQKLDKKGQIKRILYLGAYFTTFNLTIEYHRAPFLVQKGTPSQGSSSGLKTSLKLDKLFWTNSRWTDANVLIFNSGHWWTPVKIFEEDCYFEVSGALNLQMSIEDAYRTALDTWATWVQTNIDPSKTRIFFRSFESTHWGNNSTTKSCYLETEPLQTSPQFDEFNGLNRVVEDVVNKVKFHVTILYVTVSSGYRRDAHVGNWSSSPSMIDCSHWCLPGVV